MDAIQRLEAWLAKHKARNAAIDHDDGYGASCWEVYLEYENGGKTMASEFQLMEKAEKMGEKNPDWPGLAAVINAAIDHAEGQGAE